MEFPGTESFRTIDHKRFLAFIWNCIGMGNT